MTVFAGGGINDPIEFVRQHKVVSALLVLLALWIIVMALFIYGGSGSGGLDSGALLK
jgi:hypothetical protein